MWFTTTGSVLLLLGILAGLVNRNVLDGPRFAGHLDAVRRDPGVARQIGQAITDRVLTVDPDLVAVRPLVEAAATSLAGSSAFSAVFRTAARQVHGAFTRRDSGQVVLRLADVGAVLAGVLSAISPQSAARVPADLEVTLSRVAAQSFAARTVHLVPVARLLAWLLPLLGISALAAGWWLAPDRLRAAMRTGWALAAAGAGVGLLALVGSILVSTVDETTLRSALVAAAWREFGGVLWWAAAITVAAGGLLVAAVSARIPQLDLAAKARRVSTLVMHRPRRRSAQLVRGAALTVLGLGAVLRPALVLGVLGAVIGLSMLLVGVGEIAVAAGAQPVPGADTSRSRQWFTAVAVGIATALVAGLIVVDAAADRQVSAPVSDTPACNGHVELCTRRYDDVAFPATHNSMSAADEPGWFIPEQPTGLIGQLDAGIRVLLIDSWYGQTTTRPGLVATAPGSHASALAEAERLYGPDVVASLLRLHDALTPTRTGPTRPYLCHSLCEIGSTAWEPVMTQVRHWLTAHPREVVTFFVQDNVSPADTAAVFQQAGLLPYVHSQEPGQEWPTLGEMIDSGHRVVVLMEDHGGGAKYPWLLQGFDWVQDTPYSNPTTADLSCSRNRGSASSPLLLLNYWLGNDFRSLVTDARAINAHDVLWPYVLKCQRERGMIPNFLAVNFYNEGDLFRAVDELNGFD